MVGCGLINVTVERIAYKPLRNAPRLVPLITAIGMSFILQNVAIVWKGTEPIALPETPPDRDDVRDRTRMRRLHLGPAVRRS